MSDKDTKKADALYEEPSMNIALFVYLIVPVFLCALLSRYTVDTSVKPIKLVPDSRPAQYQKKRPPAATQTTTSPLSESPRKSEPIADAPTGYKNLKRTIAQRRRVITREAASGSVGSSGTQSQTATEDQAHLSKRVTNDDPARKHLHEQIEQRRQTHEKDPTDLFKAIAYADAMRIYDVQYHDGGSYEKESLRMFDIAVSLALENREAVVGKGGNPQESPNGGTNVADELALDYANKSADGILCGIYTAQGKTYFMANYFEKAVESYTSCLDIETSYLDAANSRGSALIILGRYEEAAQDFKRVVQEDEARMFTDAFQGLARVLQTRKDALPEGWKALVDVAEGLIPKMENQLQEFPDFKPVLAKALNHIYHSLFLYHDSMTKDYPTAFDQLKKSYDYKMSLLNPWKSGSELAKIEQTTRIFTHGFWPSNVGSNSEVPIFIVGFVRSGSTLLERVLDSHSQIVGTGENSVFNGRLPEIRNRIVRTSVDQPDSLGTVTKSLAEDVVTEMGTRWAALAKGDDERPSSAKPQRLVDKMLTNYYNVGFIHMLYPKALILHVVRDPMDTVFSAFKHEFPGGTLDYTSDFASLAELYKAYRTIMAHWDNVLPGRVKHVRYADMVHDMPGVAKAVIDATNLPWENSVLEFHKKKQAVNTLSTTQVRKGVYKDGLNAWTRYEEQLQPLKALLGDLVDYDISTSLESYRPKDGGGDEL